MSDTATRPLPNAQQPDTADFWTATQAGELRYQQCSDCATVVWYPRAHCPGCIDGTLEWRQASGQGTIYTYSVIRQSYHPFFRHQVPYVVAYVDLDEGPRVLSNIVGLDNPDTDVEIGQRVAVQWEVHDALSIPLFAPLD